jgi:hypothetical protein
MYRCLAPPALNGGYHFNPFGLAICTHRCNHHRIPSPELKEYRWHSNKGRKFSAPSPRKSYFTIQASRATKQPNHHRVSYP